jgi:hypothetical protein
VAYKDHSDVKENNNGLSSYIKVRTFIYLFLSLFVLPFLFICPAVHTAFAPRKKKEEEEFIVSYKEKPFFFFFSIFTIRFVLCE